MRKPSWPPARRVLPYVLTLTLTFLADPGWPGGSAAGLSSGLVAAYAFNEGTGSTVADVSGNGHTASVNGATWTDTGRYGKALSFNGTSSYVDLGNAADLQITGSMTWSAWVLATADPPDDGQIIAKSSGAGWQFKTSPDTGAHTFGVGVSRSSSSLTQRYSTTVRQLGTWYYVAGVYNAAARSLGIFVNGVLDNGVLVGTVPASQYNNAAEPVTIGQRTGGYSFAGGIDEVRIYNRALSQAEIQTDMNTPVGGRQGPDLTVTKTHTGTFTAGQSGATYTISVSNVGGEPSEDDIVTVTDTVPAGLTATAIAGTGWSCTQPAGPCARAETLAAGASYPPLTLTVDIAASPPPTLTNTARVSGGGDVNPSNNTASDVTTISTGSTGPDLTLTKTHAGTFTAGQSGATYAITVRNAGGAASSGTVTVTDTVPAGLTASGIAGTGWSCSQPAGPCTRGDALAASASYPPLTLTVDVAAGAPASVTNTANVSGGGDVNSGNNTANDVTTIGSTPGPGGTPTLVQHLSSSANPVGIGIAGNAFTFTLPNSVRASNCLILAMTYEYSATRTVSIADSNGNVWPSSPAVKASHGAGYDSVIYVLPDAHAGVTTLTVTFDAPVIPFQYTISEFYNVATTSPVAGMTAAAGVAGPNVGSGTFTPGNNDANGGNLVWSYFALADVASGNPSIFSPGAGFNLLDADIAWQSNQGFPHASEYGVQGSSAPINPSLTATGDADLFNGVSVALRASGAGTAPPPGIRIVRVAHFTDHTPPANGTWRLQFPTTGNLVAFVVNESPIIKVTNVTDTRGNAYTKREPDASDPQWWHTANSSPDTNLVLSLAISGTPARASLQAYDITGADPNPFEALAGYPVADASDTTVVVNAPSITPLSANGLTLAMLSLGLGPSTGFAAGAPAGAIFDAVYYADETDADMMENACGLGHVYQTGTTVQNWNWVITNIPGPSSNSAMGTAISFKAAPVSP